MAGKFQHEEVGPVPKGYRVRTVQAGAHQVRVAFPPGPRRKGSGKLVAILHPNHGDAGCTRRKLNPVLEAVLAGAAAGTAGALATHSIASNGKRRKRNRADAAEAFTEFHGRAPHEVIEAQEELMKAGDYFALGAMGSLWLHPVSSEDPSRWPKPDVEFLEGDKVKLAADAGGRQLYLCGGNQEIPEDSLAKMAGTDPEHRFVGLGTCYAISYLTEKKFDGYRTHEYAHQFGEQTGERPECWYDRKAKRILLVGGAYSIAPLEKELGASPGIVN